MIFLKQSTAATIVLGQFVDDTDGVTAETALTITQSEVRLSKNAGTFAQKNETTSLTHLENGYYSCELNATDTNTVGRLRIAVTESGALGVWQEATVLEEAIYDALFAASAGGFDSNGRVDVGSVLGTAQTAGDLANLITTVDTVVDSILVDTAEIGTAGAGLTAIPWNASWDAEVQSECTDALNAYDPPTKAEMDAAHSTTDALITTVDTVVDAILVDTAEIGTAGAGLTAVPWNSSWDAEVQSECADALTAHWTASMTEAYAADGAAATPIEMLYMTYAVVAQMDVVGTTLTAYKLDGTTAAMTFTLDDADDPTSRTRAT